MKVTQADFKIVKGLLRDNIMSEVVSNSPFSRSTIKNIKDARSFKQYKENIRQANKKAPFDQGYQALPDVYKIPDMKEILRLATEIRRHLDNARKLVLVLKREAK